MTHLRSIDTSGLAPVSVPDQTPPMFEWLELDHLLIDSRYQRPLDYRSRMAVQKIAANFDWDAFSAITVAPLEGGRFAVIDGQHRVHAAQLAGKTMVPAMITRISADQQARTFARVNSAIPISAHQRFRAELLAVDPTAVAVANACAAAGCEAMTYHASAAMKKPGQIWCIGTLLRLIKSGHGAALTAIRAHDTQGQVALYSDAIITPLVGAILKTGCTNPDTLRRALDLKRPWLVLEQAEIAAREAGRAIGPARIAALARQIETAKETTP